MCTINTPKRRTVLFLIYHMLKLLLHTLGRRLMCYLKLEAFNNAFAVKRGEDL